MPVESGGKKVLCSSISKYVVRVTGVFCFDGSAVVMWTSAAGRNSRESRPPLKRSMCVRMGFRSLVGTPFSICIMWVKRAISSIVISSAG